MKQWIWLKYGRCHFFEISAKSGDNIELPFIECVREIRRSRTHLEWHLHYHSNIALIGHSSGGLSELAGIITGKKLEPIIDKQTPNKRYQDKKNTLNFRTIAHPDSNIPLLIWGSTNPSVSPPFTPDITVICFSLINRPSFTKIHHEWKEELRIGYHSYLSVRILIGMHADVKKWIVQRTQFPPPIQNNDTTDYFSLLSDEIVLQIFSYLPILDAVAMASSRFSRLSKDKTLFGSRCNFVGPIVSHKEASALAKKLSCAAYFESSSQGPPCDFDDIFVKYLLRDRQTVLTKQFNEIQKSKKKIKKKFLFF